MLRAFEERNWIRRDEQYYEATQLGAYVAAGTWELIERIETEQKLRDVDSDLKPSWQKLAGIEAEHSFSNSVILPITTHHQRYSVLARARVKQRAT